MTSGNGSDAKKKNKKKKQSKKQEERRESPEGIVDCDQGSVNTIYTRAVPQIASLEGLDKMLNEARTAVAVSVCKLSSSSEEEGMDMSDEVDVQEMMNMISGRDMSNVDTSKEVQPGVFNDPNYRMVPRR